MRRREYNIKRDVIERKRDSMDKFILFPKETTSRSYEYGNASRRFKKDEVFKKT
jgi:hypothetical protein